MKSALTPLRVVENRIWRYYKGGGQLEALRGRDAVDSDYPEEWVGSTTVAAGAYAGIGLSKVEWRDGTHRVLKEVIDENPIAYLGEEHVARFGASPGLLVKLLDPAERLPVHAHPNRAFAHEHFDSAFGKTEAWLVLGTRDNVSDPHVYLGLKDEVSAAEYLGWVREQNTERILACLHRFAVGKGDVVLVPGGMPHAIGAGLFLAEVQEPTDYSFMCEHAGYPIDIADAYLGLSLEEGIGSLDLRARTVDEIDAYRIRPKGRSVLHGESEPYFAADLLRGGDESARAVYELVLAISGTGFLESASGRVAIAAGDGFVIPAGITCWRLDGSVEALVFRGPAL